MKNEKGFVLLESLISFGLVCVIVLMYIPFYLNHLTTIQDKKVEVEQARVLYDAVYRNTEFAEPYTVHSGDWNFCVKRNVDSVVVRNKGNSKEVILQFKK